MQIPIPTFIDPDHWEEFKRMRKEDIKKPLTEYAEKLAIKKLSRWHEEGYDIDEIIEDTLFNQWQGFFNERHKPKSETSFTEKLTDRSWAEMSEPEPNMRLIK